MNLAGLKKVVAMAGIALALPALSEGTSAAGPSSLPSPGAVSQSVKGEVMIVTDEFYVVQDSVGKGMVQVLVGKATKLDRSIKKGDTVEATLAADGYAVSIKKKKAR
ncbi:MAG: hypothetical protein KGJ14_01435 [Nitrospirota bacterium]|nr:hypothetical protein [Nitrospirota bacterium]